MHIIGSFVLRGRLGFGGVGRRSAQWCNGTVQLQCFSMTKVIVKILS